MAQFKNSLITGKGHALLQKVLAQKAVLDFTRIQAGDGQYDGDIDDLTALVSPKRYGRIVGVTPQGRHTDIECLLTNQGMTEPFQFNELGVLANDPEDGEILFAYTSADVGDYIGIDNGRFLTEEEFTIQVYTANTTDINVIIAATTFASEIEYKNDASGLEAQRVQEAIDELAEMLKSGAFGSSGIELSDSDIPNTGVKSHLKISEQLSIWPGLPGFGEEDPGVLQFDSGDTVGASLQFSDGTVEPMLVNS